MGIKKIKFLETKPFNPFQLIKLSPKEKRWAAIVYSIRAFVVTSTQNHRIIHLFNIIEILNKFKISSLQISCSIWKFDKNIAGILDFLCYSLFTFFLQQTKMTIINSLKPRFHSQTMSIPFNPYFMVQPDLRLVAR